MIINRFSGGGSIGNTMEDAVITLGPALIYNGSLQTQTIQSVVVGGNELNPDTDYIVIGNTGTFAGDYIMTIMDVRHGNFGGFATVAWSITKQSVAKPTVSGSSFVWSGSAQGPVITGFDEDFMIKSGTESATGVGNYTVSISLSNDCYEWSDHTTAPVSLNWAITVKTITKPTASGTSKTYNGSSQSPTVTGYDENYMSKSGTESAVNAGSYSLTISLLDTANNEWADHTTAAVVVAWSIARINGSVTSNPASLSLLTTVNGTKTAALTVTGDGTLSVASSATGVCTASVSGTTVTVTLKGTGTATVTVTKAQGTNYKQATCTISVSCTKVDPVLANNSLSVIKAVAQAGTGASFWSVGDKTAAITLGNKTIGGLSLNNLTVYAFIIGFNHNQSYEGKGIHFQVGMTSAGKCVALVDSYYDSENLSGLCMGNKAYWSGSTMRTTICTNFYDALPSDWRGIIADCVKYTDNSVHSGSSRKETDITSTTDKVWLLAQYEVFGTYDGVNSYEKNKQAQYAYYANGNSHIKYKHSATSDKCRWWLRSRFASSSSSSNYYLIYAGIHNAGGNISAYGLGLPSESLGFAPGFKVG